jgi:muconate cycloisomerase
MKLMDHLGKEIDLEKVKAVREAVGPHMSIRVDANGTLPSIQTLKKMEKYDLALVEQPANDLKGMKKYADALDIPVLVDEYIRGPVEALNIVEQKAADIIAVKDYQVGGIYKAKQIHAMLKPFAAPCYFEATIRSSIGTAASLQLISSEAGTPGSVFGCIAGPLMVEDLVKEPVRFGAGYAEVPTKPGLGVELDEEKLKKLTVTI